MTSLCAKCGTTCPALLAAADKLPCALAKTIEVDCTKVSVNGISEVEVCTAKNAGRILEESAAGGNVFIEYTVTLSSMDEGKRIQKALEGAEYSDQLIKAIESIAPGLKIEDMTLGETKLEIIEREEERSDGGKAKPAKDEDDNTGVIIGVVVGCILGLAIIVGCICMAKQRANYFDVKESE